MGAAAHDRHADPAAQALLRATLAAERDVQLAGAAAAWPEEAAMTDTILVPLLPAEIRALVLWHRLESRGRSELGTDVHMLRISELQAVLDGKPA